MKNVKKHLLFAICENVPDAICLIDADWNIQAWNKGAEDLLGYRVDEITGKSVAVIIPEEIAQREIDHCIGELNAKGKMSAYETVRRTKDGRIIPIELTAVALREAGAISHYAAIMRDMTERKRMQNALMESEASLRAIFNAASDAIFVHEIETGRIVEVNQKFFDLYEYREQDVPSLDIETLTAETEHYNQAEALRLLKKTASGEPQFFEWSARSRTGRTFPIDVSLRLMNFKGRDRILATVRDITGRKQTEEALKLTQFSVDHASVNVYLVDRDARLLYVNEQTCRMLGYTREEMLSMGVYDIDPDFPRSVWDEHWNELKTKGRLHFETQQRAKNGRLIPLELSLNYVSFAGREYNVAFGTDISDRKKAESEFAAISRRNKLILESAGEGICGLDSARNHTFVNAAGMRMLGYAAEELTGRQSHPIWHHSKPDGSPYPEDECPIYLTLRDGVSRRVDDEVFWKKDGTSVPVAYTTTPIIEGAAIVGAVVTFRDITERKQAVSRLRESEEKYRSIVETSTDWIWEMDLRGRLLYSNPAVENVLGYRPDEIIGRNGFDFLYEEDREEAASRVRKAVERKQGWKACLLRWMHKDGSLRFIESNSAPVFNDRGELTGFRGSDHDVTELKHAQESLQHAYADLEKKVRERTRELARANEELRMEITERRRAVSLIQKSKELSDALNMLDAVIHSTLNIDEILQRVVEEAAGALKADGSMIGTYENGMFRVRHVHNMPEAFVNRSLTPNELRAMQYVAEAKDAVAFNDAFNDERLNRQFVAEIGIRSLIVAPILIKDRIDGAMAFYGLSRRIEFGDEHIDFARKLGASVSLALENARLYHALSEAEKISASRLRQLRNIYDTAPVGLCFIDPNKRFISINRRLAGINEVSVQDTVGRTIREVLPEAAAAIEDMVDRTLKTGKPVENLEITEKTKSGQEMTVLANYYPVKDEAGAITGINIMVQDITRRKRVEEALQASERRLRSILNGIPDMAWFKDRESRFILVNEAFAQSAGAAPGLLAGKTDFDVWPRELAEKYRADDQEVIESGERKRLEEPLSASDGGQKWIETIKTPIRDEAGEVIGTVGIARDTTDRKRMEEEIKHMAQHDALTGLPNRRLFIDIVKLELAQARRHGTRVAILFLDLDRFKEINDTLGHDFGDMLLQQVAGRFRNSIRESDSVARIGGDEFNMVLSDIGRAEDVSDIAQKIVNCVRDPFTVNSHQLHTTTSVGISIYPDDSDEIETLLRYADIAMYHAKENGRNTFRFYNPSINLKSIEKMKLEGMLHQTISRGELSVHYQPQVDIKTGRMSHVEALVRWNHPERGFLEPGDFLPLAEETGFIATIDEWVLRTVCNQARSWKETGFDSFSVTVNFSAHLFQRPDVVSMVSSVLKETSMPPKRLDIEVTENTAMRNIEQTASLLRQLTEMGVHISIDDFGTGYSSLSYLKKLPIERIKIDKSFILDIARDPDDRAIISAVTSMARQMGIRTVAEGVETEEQFAFVKDAGCDEVQGFLVSRPLTPERFRALAKTL